MEQLSAIVNQLVYVAEAAVALLGAYYVIIVIRRVAQARFRNEEEQEKFLDTLDDKLVAGNFEEATTMCDEDDRALSQLALLAITNREMGPRKIRTLITDRFQRDVLADLDYRLSWVYTVIKTAPMLGLLGTVMGMMGAFSNLGSGQKVDSVKLATDISFALLTTIYGLVISIPLMVATNYITVRIRKMEDLMGVGMTRLMDTLKAVLTQAPPQE
jgi:biopolymer transport protein ExbB